MRDENLHSLLVYTLAVFSDGGRVNFEHGFENVGAACIFEVELFEVVGIEEEDGYLLVAFLLGFVTEAANAAEANVMIRFELVVQPFHKLLPDFAPLFRLGSTSSCDYILDCYLLGLHANLKSIIKIDYNNPI